MARITHVKHARARFEMVEKRDDFGGLVQVPVTGRDGKQKTTKSGKLVFRTLTVQDRTKPLPNYKCGRCGAEILPGMPYKWIEPQSRGLMVRCTDCPNWNVWEYSSSLAARIAEIQSNAESALAADFDSPEDLTSILSDIASEIRSLAEEKEEAASNMEEGFGHETYQSQEIAEQADQLNEWADEVENVDIPDLPEPSCGDCEGTGRIDCPESGNEDHDKTCDRDGCDGDMFVCDTCDGSGEALAGEEPALDEWREEARAAAQEAVDNCPL